MKPVYQTEFGTKLGDCFRACVASIFELPIEDIPNFWKQTQNVHKFWELIDNWTVKNKGFRCLSVRFAKKDINLVDKILCIAIGPGAPNSKVDHAVVWKDGLLHDPHPDNTGLCKQPYDFCLFVPINPLNYR